MTDSTATDGARPAGATSFYLNEIWHAAGGAAAQLEQLRFGGHGNLPSVFPVTDLAVAAVGAAGLALAEWIETSTGRRVPLAADRRLAAFWFGNSLRPAGWALPPLWDPIAGDYRAADGWIRLHTNAPHHRAAALSVLGVPLEREAVAQAVARWGATELESAIVEAHGCAAAMRSSAAWAEHPQGRAVALEPLLQRVSASPQRLREWPVDAARPLRGVRVLDLTRIIAGPVATRFLAGFGADVLRIDPPAWEEPGTVPDVVLGKRCARLDLRAAPDRAIFERLLADADVLVHGYRSDALAGLGWPAERRRELNPSLLDVALDAYGWTGLWAARRGFDSLLQMSSGIAEAGMRLLGREVPTPLPVQALDHAAGYVLATAVLRGLTERWRDGCGSKARTSLARIAQLLMAGGYSEYGTVPLAPETPEDHAPQLEQTGWGPARRVLPPVTVAGAPMFWDLPANRLGSAQPGW